MDPVELQQLISYRKEIDNGSELNHAQLSRYDELKALYLFHLKGSSKFTALPHQIFFSLFNFIN
jgi:hypothetical protein